MHRNHIFTIWTSVRFDLFRKKLRHTFCFNCFDVFNHAHFVSFAVAFVEMGEVFAGNRFTLATGLELVFGEFWAASFYVAVFGPWNAAFAV